MAGTLEFGRIIRSERDRRGLTQQQLGQRVGVSDSYIAHIESGLKTPSLDVTIALAETFGFTEQQQQALLEALENSRLDRSTRRIRTRGRAVRGGIRTMQRTGRGAIRVIDLESGAVTGSLATGRNIRLLRYSPDGRWIAGSDDHGAVFVWDTESGELAGNIAGSGAPLSALAFLVEGSQVITAAGASVLTIFDVASGGRIEDIETELDRITVIEAAAEEEVFAAADGSGRVALWGGPEQEPAWLVEGHDDAVTCLAFSPDGELLASGGEDSRIQLWDAASGDEERSMEHPGTIVSLCFSPDRQLLASGSSEGTVELWDTADGREVHALDAGAGEVGPLAFRSDGWTLIAAYAQGVVVTWDSRTGGARRKSELKDGSYSALVLSPDARRVAGFDPAFDAVPDEYDPERIARDLAGDRDLLAAYRDLRSAMAGSPEQRRAVLTTLRALARSD